MRNHMKYILFRTGTSLTVITLSWKQVCVNRFLKKLLSTVTLTVICQWEIMEMIPPLQLILL